MKPISFKRHRFPPGVIRRAVWLYFRFTLSIRDVEEFLAQRGVQVSREAIRCCAIKFGPLNAANIRQVEPDCILYTDCLVLYERIPAPIARNVAQHPR